MLKRWASGVQTLDQNSSKQTFIVEKWAEAPAMVSPEMGLGEGGRGKLTGCTGKENLRVTGKEFPCGPVVRTPC